MPCAGSEQCALSLTCTSVFPENILKDCYWEFQSESSTPLQTCSFIHPLFTTSIVLRATGSLFLLSLAAVHQKWLEIKLYYYYIKSGHCA